VGSNKYLYDANGNVSSRAGPNIPAGDQLFDYTPFDLPKAILYGSSFGPNTAVTQFEYSADEERLVSRDSSGTRHFVADLYQRKLDSAHSTQEERFRLYAGDRQIAEITRQGGSDQTLYLHPDHLGTPETISDNHGATFHEHFDPFGAPVDTPNPELTRIGFTGQDHDTDLGLIDMKGRIYDPLAGRFMTPDPVTQAPFWSQGLNRYSYVFNDPINNTDPSGFESTGLWVGSGAFTAGDVGLLCWASGCFEGAAAAASVGGSAAAAGAGSAIGAGASVAGIAGLNIGTSLFTGLYDMFDGSAASTRSLAAPSGAPRGTGLNRGGGAGATGQIGNVGVAKRPPSACDVGMCLAQSTTAGEGGPSYQIRNDGTGGGVPVDQRSTMLDELVSLLGGEISAAINIIVTLEQHREALLLQMEVANMVPPPKDLQGFPGTRRASPKTSVQGGGGLRKRWVDESGGIYEWDSQHGAVERYDKRGKHLGEFDAKTGQRTKPADPKRRVDP
jgi:RHS repeat-associated protein